MGKTPEQIWNEALEAANKAAQLENASLPPENNRGFDCGFAWVVIQPARGAFVKFLKQNKIGGRHYAGGYEIWYSRLHQISTQSVTVHQAAARACAEVLKQNGINAFSDSRLD